MEISLLFHCPAMQDEQQFIKMRVGFMCIGTSICLPSSSLVSICSGEMPNWEIRQIKQRKRISVGEKTIECCGKMRSVALHYKFRFP